ncbi:MAG: S8 family serine peptidase [Burkholderiaceae bacterium]|nr:MAG: S8 family serine peptidase [Burkholderiaceae bacterium]
MVPGHAQDSPQAPDLLQHLLPSRFPAAWNAAFDARGQLAHGGRCSTIAATVIVVDYFQSEPANTEAQLDTFDGAGFFGAFTHGPDDHGWQVAATLASPFDAVLPTGAAALTECVQYALLDISGLTYEQIVALLKQAIGAQPADRKLIVNLSLGFGKKFCGPGVDQLCTAENAAATPPGLLQWEIERRVLAAIEWAAFTNAALEQRLLLVQAAGNERAARADNGGLGVRYAGMRQARLISPFALATQLGALEALYSPRSQQAVGLWTSAAQPSLLLDDARVQFLQQMAQRRASRVPGLDNLLLVGSATLPATHWHGDIAESAFSNEGAMLLAVGEEVVSLGGVLRDGTSFAAPQVSGLAAYLWAISELKTRPAAETAALLKATATSKSLLDAYAATQALDAQPAIGTPRIREALLDVDADGRFDERDLQRFADAYGLANPTPPTPEARDYSRFDLNGDGATGGINALAFDLDRAQVAAGGAPRFDAVERTIEDYSVTFNEPVLSDLQVLCYYAYSALYAGGSPTPAQEAFRTSVLGPDRCVRARMNTRFASQVSGPAPLEVTVEVPAGNGQYAPAPDLHVAFTPSCGSVSPSSGRTDAAGRLSTTVAPEGCSSSVTVTAVASANEGTEPLARKTVTAAVGDAAAIRSLSLDVGGSTPGRIDVSVSRSDDGFWEVIASVPIAEVASLDALVNAALVGTSRLEIGLGVRVAEPVTLDLNVDLEVGGVVILGATPAACASNISVRVGAVRRGDGIGSGMAGVAGCLGRVALTVGDVSPDDASRGIHVAATNTAVSVTAGRVGRVAVGNSYFGGGASGMRVDTRTQSYGTLVISQVSDSTVSVQGSLQRVPGQVAGLWVQSSSNLTLSSIAGSELTGFYIDHSSFASPPSIAVGQLKRLAGDTGSNSGFVQIVASSGLSLGSITMGDVEGDLSIQDNRGFSNEDARAFAQQRSVGGATRISGNQP